MADFGFCVGDSWTQVAWAVRTACGSITRRSARHAPWISQQVLYRQVTGGVDGSVIVFDKESGEWQTVDGLGVDAECL